MRREIDADEREALEELEARFRQTYDPEQKVYDGRKRRVTDLKENNRVTLPKPLRAEIEAGIELRRNLYQKTCREFIDIFCDESGDQESNLSENEKRGLS